MDNSKKGRQERIDNKLIEANTKLLNENKELKEEIERLNKTNNEIFKANENLAEEIEKLNNNWNELEKFICDLEIECNIDSSMWGVAVIIHNKLKELKGSDKE